MKMSKLNKNCGGKNYPILTHVNDRFRPHGLFYVFHFVDFTLQSVENSSDCINMKGHGGIQI